jgi:hypothetical protein
MGFSEMNTFASPLRRVQGEKKERPLRRVQKDIAAQNLKDWTKFAAQTNEKQKQKIKFF